MNFIVVLYSSNRKRQLRTVSVVKFPYVIFLCSVYTLIRCPIRMVRNYFRFSPILRSSLSVVVKRICAGVNLSG